MSYKSAYYQKLRDPRWQKKRLEILAAAGWKCQCCNDAEKTLNVHHLVYKKGEPWDIPNDHLEALCENCHERRESFNKVWGRCLIPTKLCLEFEEYFLWVFGEGAHFFTKHTFNQMIAQIHRAENVIPAQEAAKAAAEKSPSLCPIPSNATHTSGAAA